MVVHHVVGDALGCAIEEGLEHAVGEPTVAEENVHQREQGEEPVELVLHGSPRDQGQQRDEQNPTRRVHHGEQNQHRVGHGVARPAQAVLVQAAPGDDEIDDERSAHQNEVQQQGGGVDAFSGSPDIGCKGQ